MATFSVAGTTLAVTDFEEIEPRTKGELAPTFNNTLTSTMHSPKRRLRVTSAPVSRTIYQSMKTAFANGASMTVTGDLLLGDSLTMRGTLKYREVGIGTADSGYLHLYVMDLALEEA